jgi:HEAT repeat protein
MASDKSAPVRAALAEVIGEERWKEGLNALVQLLDDGLNTLRNDLPRI